MVGEIRDLETAQMAVQAALTGHLGAIHAAHQRRRLGDDPPARFGRTRII
jgi:Tfp pilus assembly pilus retraction ATPase PilT